MPEEDRREIFSEERDLHVFVVQVKNAGPRIRQSFVTPIPLNAMSFLGVLENTATNCSLRLC